MTSILKVDTIQDTAGNNIINESGDTITIGASGDTITIPSGATLDVNGIDFPTADGTAGQALITDGSGTLSFSTVGAAAGQVIQVVTTADTTNRTVSSSSFTTTTVSASITPASASNKILILVSGIIGISTSQQYAYLTVFRGATNLGNTNGFSGAESQGDQPVNVNASAVSVSFLDSPNTTSSTTYTIYTRTGAASCNFGRTSTQTITLLEIKG
jgi:hypothetical protein